MVSVGIAEVRMYLSAWHFAKLRSRRGPWCPFHYSGMLLIFTEPQLGNSLKSQYKYRGTYRLQDFPSVYATLGCIRTIEVRYTAHYNEFAVYTEAFSHHFCSEISFIFILNCANIIFINFINLGKYNKDFLRAIYGHGQPRALYRETKSKSSSSVLLAHGWQAWLLITITDTVAPLTNRARER